MPVQHTYENWRLFVSGLFLTIISSSSDYNIKPTIRMATQEYEPVNHTVWWKLKLL